MTVVAEPVPIRFKFTPQRRRTEAERAEEFRNLAMSTDTTDAAAECAVRAWAHHSLLMGDGRKAWDAFTEYRDALLTADGIENDEIGWEHYAPYTCGDRKQQAWMDACGDADGWLKVLLNGHTSGRSFRARRIKQKAGA